MADRAVKLQLDDTVETVIDPATEDKQDDIITILTNINSLFNFMTEKWISGNLADADTGGGIFGVLNPESADIIITHIILYRTVNPSGTLDIDIGYADDAITLSNNYDTVLGFDTLETLPKILDLNSYIEVNFLCPNGKYITCSTDSGSASGLVGKYYISYILA